MLFNSNEFLFIFLPVTLLAYHLLRHFFAGWVAFVSVFVASVLFYAFWSVPYCMLFLLSISVNYAFASAIYKNRSRSLTASAIILNLALLGYFKYTNFFLSVVDGISGSPYEPMAIILPIGISFYTFIQIAFLADVYAGKAFEPSFGRYGLFVSFFPHMLAGPIVHHSEMMPQFRVTQHRAKLFRSLCVGMVLLGLGLFKKAVIADRIAPLANPVFAQAAAGNVIDFFNAWIAVLSYTFQIYFDFSGYSDMAIGIALMFGIRFPANFNSPYKAGNIIDFWRRWHMTLSRLLRDYIYIPLGGNRKGRARRYINLFATMLIGGFWHGAGWTFILWGGLHGTFLVANHLWQGRRRPSFLSSLWGPVLTFFCVMMAWVPFRAETMDACGAIFRGMFGFNGLSAPLEFKGLLDVIGLSANSIGLELVAANDRADFYAGLAVLALAMVIAFILPNSLRITGRFSPVLDIKAVDKDGTSNMAFLRWRPNVVSGVLIGLAFYLSLRAINSAAPSEFLYFQF